MNFVQINYLTILIIVLCSLVIAAEGSGLDDDRENLVIVENYEALRSVAISGSGDDKLAVFVYVAANLPRLHDKLPEAVRLLRLSAKAGIQEAQYNLGYLYSQGMFVSKNSNVALCWLRTAAEKGHKRAMLWLGITYIEKFKETTNPSKAEDTFRKADLWLRKLANDPEAPLLLALTSKETLGRAHLRKSIFDQEGWKLLMEAAESGHSDALDTLKRMRVFLERQIDEGYDEAIPILAQVSDFLEKE